MSLSRRCVGHGFPGMPLHPFGMVFVNIGASNLGTLLEMVADGLLIPITPLLSYMMQFSNALGRLVFFSAVMMAGVAMFIAAFLFYYDNYFKQ